MTFATSLGRVGVPRYEIQQAPLGARALAPEQRERHEVDGLAPGGDARELGEELELALAASRRLLRAPQQRRQPRGAQEQEQRLARTGDAPELSALPSSAGSPRPRLRSARIKKAGTLRHQRRVVPVADAVREGREPQPLAREQRVEQEVVEAARVAHHVHDGAARLELAQLRDGRLVEVEVLEEAPREPAEEQVEARRHRARGVGDARIGDANACDGCVRHGE